MLTAGGEQNGFTHSVGYDGSQKQTMLHSLQQCNDISQRYGLMLSTAQMLALVQERQAALWKPGALSWERESCRR